MQNLNTILVLYTLRLALMSLEQNPDLDHEYPGTRNLTTILKRQIRTIENRSHLVNDGWLRPDPATARRTHAKRTLSSKPPVTVAAKTSLPSIRDSKVS